MEIKLLVPLSLGYLGGRRDSPLPGHIFHFRAIFLKK